MKDKLDIILDRYQATQLRPLSRDDRMAFAGASDDALIGEADWGILILDGTHIQAIVLNSDTEDECPDLSGDFPKPATARLIAEYLMRLKGSGDEQVRQLHELLEIMG